MSGDDPQQMLLIRPNTKNTQDGGAQYQPALVLTIPCDSVSTDGQYHNNDMRTMTASRDRYEGYANSMHTRNQEVSKINGEHAKHFVLCTISAMTSESYSQAGKS